MKLDLPTGDIVMARMFNVPTIVQREMKEMHYEIVTRLCADQHIVLAIKFVRSEYNLGLREAKDWVDFIRAGNSGLPTY